MPSCIGGIVFANGSNAAAGVVASSCLPHIGDAARHLDGGH